MINKLQESETVGSLLLMITNTSTLAMDLQRCLLIITLLEQKDISGFQIWIG